MLVLSGKKMKYAVLCLFIIILIITIILNVNKNNNDYISTVSLPVSGKVVVVDARTWCA